jgi:Ca2+ transporting ATPase
MVCIAILIVCVPEGMPVAVSIAAAFSMDRMQEDELLIKGVGALEAAG